MFSSEPVTQLILLARVINMHAQLQVTNAPGRTRKPYYIYKTVACVAKKSVRNGDYRK